MDGGGELLALHHVDLVPEKPELEDWQSIFLALRCQYMISYRT